MVGGGCVAMDSAGVWSDILCNTSLPYLCKYTTGEWTSVDITMQSNFTLYATLISEAVAIDANKIVKSLNIQKSCG